MAKNYTLEKQKNGKTREAKCLKNDDIIITGDNKGAVKARAKSLCEIRDPNSGENPIDKKWIFLIIAMIIITIIIFII